MALSDTALRNAKPQDTKYKLYDDGGLLIVVAPSGGKSWRFKYRLNGAEKQLSFGTYPDVTLKAARLKRDEARSLVAGVRIAQSIFDQCTDDLNSMHPGQ